MFMVYFSTYVILLPPSCAWCNNYTFLLQNRWVLSKRESTWASPHDSSTPSSPRQRTPSAATPSAHSRSATFFVLSKASPSILGERGSTHCKQDPIYVFPEMKLRGLVPNFHIHMYLWAIYINIKELGTRLRLFISGNICFEFSVQCLCSAGSYISPVLPMRGWRG
jgi:hypothetical protein